MTEFYIKAQGETVYSRIDLEAGVPLPFTYNILDIREPDKRDSHYSKTLEIPGTKANNILFQHIFEIGTDNSQGFNPNKKADFYAIQDNCVEVFRGVMQLRKITRKEGLDLIYYETVAFGGNDDLFTNLADDKVNVLDFSDYDHVFTLANQAASWSVTPGSGYVYPMIDYKGRMLDDPDWYIEDFRPALFAKEYVDKIFEYAGKTYTSAFLTSDRFKRLIIPMSEKYQYNDADIIAREFRAELASDFDITTTALRLTGAIEFNDGTATSYDPSGIFDNSNFTWTVPAGQSGFYNISSYLEPSILFTTSAGSLVVSAGNDIRVIAYVRINNVTKESASQLITVPPATYASGDEIAGEPMSLSLENVFLSEGDDIFIRYDIFRAGPITFSGTGAAIKVRFAEDGYFKNAFQNEIAEDMDLAMNNTLPDVSMKDFIMGIVKMFRLYIDIDKDNPNNYLIEPRDDYYTSEVVNWSDKLDLKQGLEILPVAELQGRRYIFRYKDDKDIFNDDYQKKFTYDGKAETYGQRNIEIDNDFVTEEVITEPIFSPTPLVGNDYNSRVIPAMYAMNGDTPKEIEANIRILYWGGLKTFTGKQWLHWDSSAGVHKTQYPYAGHLDDPLAPRFDLSFGMPKEVYYDIRVEEYTNANLYNTYHRRGIEEVTDINSRLVIGHFRLKPTDIFSLSFRKLYFFEGQLYRLNRVIDYDMDEEGLTRCEFFLAKDPGAYVPQVFVPRGGKDGGSAGEKLPDTFRPRLPNDNTFDPKQTVVTGTGNVIGKNVIGGVIIGDDNIIGSGSKNITIVGTGNTITGGTQDVTLIQCEGLTVENDGELWINNCLVDSCPATQDDVTEEFNDRSGTATLTDSTVTVVNAQVTISAVIILTPVDVFTGVLTVTAGVGSFDIDSSVASESGVVNYFIAKF